MSTGSLCTKRPWALPRRAALAILAAAAVITAPVEAQFVMPVSTSFDVLGFIQQATVDNPNDIFSGGSITVNNMRIVVPRNLVLQFPATSMTWQETFKLAPAPYTGLQTGMALQDVPKPHYAYEVRVQGNRVGDRNIAGLILLAQHSLATGQGYITSIDYAAGEMRIGGIVGAAGTGERVRINDPIGRFGPAFSPDVRFTIDEDNPTIKAATFYPMCLPRGNPATADDPLCPQKNRPRDLAGTLLGVFTMPPVGSGANLPDARLTAPLEIGDYVTYAGILVDDAAGTYVAAHTIDASLTILTAPGTTPAYVGMDVLLMGVSTKAGAPPGTEGVVRTRVEGFSTDISASTVVSVFALDVDPCSGNESERLWGIEAIDNLAQFGRFRFRPVAANETFLPAVRELRVRNSTGKAGTATPNGLFPGEYTAPIFEFIFPEAAPAGGVPPPPNNFQDFQFLAQGEGTYFGAGANPSATGYGIPGQLAPWPGPLNPTPSSCATPGPVPPPPPPPGTLAPIANADTLPPAAAGGGFTFSAANLLANDTGTSLRIVAVAPLSTAGGTISGSDPFTFVPGAGFVGSDTFVYQIADAFGQTAVGVVNVTLVADTAAPIVNLSGPLGGTVSGVVTVSANATDNIGVAGVTFFDGATPIGPEDTTAPYQVPWTTTGLANFSSHTLTATARDSSGNTGTSTPITVVVNNVDATPPAATITAPAAGPVSGTVTITVNATDNVGVAGVSFFDGATPIGAEDTAAPYSVTWNTSALAALSSHTLTAHARDAAGNVGTSPIVIVTIADVIPPVVTMTAPPAGATITGTSVGLTATASDNSGIVLGVQFLLDGAPLNAEDASAPYATVLNATTLVNGSTHQLSARARDGSGNTATSPAITVTVNNGLSGPVLALSFNESSGTAFADASGNGNTGTSVAAAHVPGQAGFGGALSFDGLTSLVTVAHSASLNLTTGMTLEAWVNPSQLAGVAGASGWRTVMMKERTASGLSYALYANDGNPNPARPAGYARVGGADRTTTAGPGLPVNTWSHLALTYDGATLRMYVNGVLRSSAAIGGPLVTSTNALRIGGDTVFPSEFFAGLIDEVRVYNRALSPAEIAADMTNPIIP